MPTTMKTRKVARPAKATAKTTVQELQVPDTVPLLGLMDFNKLDRIMERTLAKHFYSELEIAMNELMEQKNKFKEIVAEYLGENKVPHTPKKNPPGALAWRRIAEHKTLNFESDEDVSADGEASILRDAPEIRNVSPILPARRVLELIRSVPKPSRSRDLFTDSPQTARMKTPIRVTPKLCDFPQQAPVPPPRLLPTPKQTPVDRKQKTPEMPKSVVEIEPIVQDLILPEAKGDGKKREIELASVDSISTTSIPTTVSTLVASSSKNPRRVMHTAKKEEDKTLTVKKIEEKLFQATQNHDEIIKEKAERARRDREQRAHRVEMNNRNKLRHEQEQFQETKAREQKVRDFQAVQMQQSSTPYALRSNPAPIHKTPTRIPVPTPGRQAVPLKKTKKEVVSPYAFPTESPAPTTSQNKRKQAKPAAQPKTTGKKKLSAEAKRQIEVQKAIEAERLRCAQEKREADEREAERIRNEEEQEAQRLEETRRLEEALRLKEEQRMEEEKLDNENLQTAEESMVVESDERVEAPEENDADVESSTELTDRIQELSMVDNDDDDSKENEAPAQVIPPLLPTPMNKTFDKVANVNKSSYDITPSKVFLPSTAENYNVDDLSSSDSTDDEESPRKTIPQWARSVKLVPHVRKIDTAIPAGERAVYFGTIQAPNIYQLFPTKKKYPSRTSSAIWTSPLSDPTPGYSRYREYVSNAK